MVVLWRWDPIHLIHYDLSRMRRLFIYWVSRSRQANTDWVTEGNKYQCYSDQFHQIFFSEGYKYIKTHRTSWSQSTNPHKNNSERRGWLVSFLSETLLTLRSPCPRGITWLFLMLTWLISLSTWLFHHTQCNFSVTAISIFFFGGGASNFKFIGPNI